MDGQAEHGQDGLSDSDHGHVITDERIADQDHEHEHGRDGLSDHGHVVTAGRLADQDHEAKDDENQVVIEEVNELISKDAESDLDSDDNVSDEDNGGGYDEVDAMKTRVGCDDDDDAKDES